MKAPKMIPSTPLEALELDLDRHTARHSRGLISTFGNGLRLLGVMMGGQSEPLSRWLPVAVEYIYRESRLKE